jgi:RNA polymerase sigma factor (sigma-70 family)
MNTLFTVESVDDAELVSLSLGGDREAFGAIIARYQSLICALAYSVCGDRGRSEDLAQDTFVSAWKSLGGLQDPAKLKSWLCGIARNLTNNSLRRAERTPTALSEPLEPEPASVIEDPHEQVVNKEEEALVWQALEAMEPQYREPLVLFYREGQSARAVAEALDLSEDAVNQRLSRGRTMLRKSVARTVETALAKGAPGKAFTAAVLAILPLAATSAKAASVGTLLAQGGGAAKSAAALGGLAGGLAMLGGMFVTLKSHVDEAKSPRERQLLQFNIGLQVVGVALVGLGYYLLARQHWFEGYPARDIFNAAVLFAGSGLGALLVIYVSRRRREIQVSDGTYVEAEWTQSRRALDDVRGEADAGSPRKALRHLAMVLVWTVVVTVEGPWKQHPAGAVILAVVVALYAFWFYHRWRNRPQFQELRATKGYLWLVALGLLGTLLQFDTRQFRGHPGPVSSPEFTIAYNAVVIVAYGGMAAFLVWWDKRGTRPVV